MKSLLTLLIGFILTTTVYADCGPGGIFVFPSGNTISQNSIFVISGYGSSMSVIRGLNNEHEIYLKSGDEKVNLIVKEVLFGQRNLIQAVLAPATPLQPGLEYELVIDSLSKYVRFKRYNKKYENMNRINLR